MYEGQTRFDVIYGTVSNGNTSATAGVQRDDNCLYSILLRWLRGCGQRPPNLQLRRCNANPNANCYTDRHPNGDSDGNSTSHSHADTNGNSASHADSYSKWDTYSDPGSNRAASTQSRA